MLCCYVSVFVPLKVLKPSPLDARVRLNYLLSDYVSAKVDPIRSRLEWNHPWGCSLHRLVPIYSVIFWLGTLIIFTSISSHGRLSHPRQGSEQDRPSHGGVNIYPAHSSSSYCSAPVWWGRISFTQQVYVVISCHWEQCTKHTAAPMVQTRKDIWILPLFFFNSDLLFLFLMVLCHIYGGCVLVIKVDL